MHKFIHIKTFNTNFNDLRLSDSIIEINSKNGK